MHPDRGIVRTYRSSDGISTRLNDHNTLTSQSADTNDSTRVPFHRPVISLGQEVLVYRRCASEISVIFQGGFYISLDA